MLLFPIATLNRETTFLLTIFFACYFFRRLAWVQYLAAGAYQAAVYCVIKVFIERMFADRPGVSFSWNVTRNLVSFANHPLTALIILAGVILVVILILRGWREKPAFLRDAFLVIFPLQLVLYFSLGGYIEMRVFAEFFPALILLMAPVRRTGSEPSAVTAVHI